MSTSNQCYKELAIPYFKEVFDIIDKVMTEADAPYYLVGASAVALQLLQQNIKPPRGTKDIDFAVMLSSITEYDAIVEGLIENGFSEVKGVPHRLYHREYDAAVDILPFGEIEEDSTVRFVERNTELHVLGFREVLESPNETQIEQISVKVPTLPGMVVLKLIAWGDRPDQRDNDLADVLVVLDNFFDLEYDDIVENHHDTFPVEGEFDRLKIAAKVLGRKVQEILAKNPKVQDRIKELLNENLTDVEQSSIAKEWARLKGCEVKYSIELLQAFHEGLTE